MPEAVDREVCTGGGAGVGDFALFGGRRRNAGGHWSGADVTYAFAATARVSRGCAGDRKAGGESSRRCGQGDRSVSGESGVIYGAGDRGRRARSADAAG